VARQEAGYFQARAVVSLVRLGAIGNYGAGGTGRGNKQVTGLDNDTDETFETGLRGGQSLAGVFDDYRGCELAYCVVPHTETGTPAEAESILGSAALAELGCSNCN
jgi:hypothetical protein